MNEAERRWREHRGDAPQITNDGPMETWQEGDIVARVGLGGHFERVVREHADTPPPTFARPSWREAHDREEFSVARAVLLLAILLSACAFWIGVAWLVWP